MQAAEGWDRAEVHSRQPAVDHKVAGDIPEMRIPPLAACLVTQSHMQQFVSENKFRFLETERGRGIDEQLLLFSANCGDSDAEALADQVIFHDRERRRERTEKGIAVDEPTARAVCDGEDFARLAKVRLAAAGEAY